MTRGRSPGRAPGLGVPTMAAIVAVALLVRVLYVVLALRGYHPTTDDSHYNDIARKVSEGRGIASQFPYPFTHPTAFRPPLYPVLLGGAYALFGVHIGVAQALNVVLGAGVVLLAALLAFRLAGRTAALVSAGLAAIHPALLANDGVILTEPLSLLLMLAALLALGSRRFWLAGLFAGLLVLTRPSAQLFVPVVAVYLLFTAGRRAGRDQWRARLRSGLAAAVTFGAVAVAVVAPWVIRNDRVLGQPVIVTSNGFNLAAIWSPLALRQGYFVDPIRDPRNAPVLRQMGFRLFNEAQLDDRLRREGLEGLSTHKGLIPRMLQSNLRLLFDQHWRQNDNPEKLDGRNLGFRHATLPLVWLVIAAGGVGLVLLFRRGPLGQLVLLSAGYFVAVGIVTVSPPRLRAPFDVLACVGVGVLVGSLLRYRRRRRSADASDEQPAGSLVGAGS